jgi:RimJ/RimL family protein N-acetyltransferase
MNMAEIIIRKAKPGDEKGIAELAREGLRRKNFLYTGNNQPFSKERIERMKKALSSRNPDSYSFVAIDSSNNQLAGSVIFSFKKKGRLEHRVDLGWAVHPDYQGRGIGSRLLRTALSYAKERGFKRAEAEVAIENVASVKLAKTLGFRIEGIKKKALLTDDGRYIDTYVLGRVF